jgi:hypothetical protein
MFPSAKMVDGNKNKEITNRLQRHSLKVKEATALQLIVPGFVLRSSPLRGPCGDIYLSVYLFDNQACSHTTVHVVTRQGLICR